MSTASFNRIMNQLCSILGFEQTDALAAGAKLRIDGHLVTFAHDDIDAHDGISVYVDLGSIEGDESHALSVLMQLNFGLGVGDRGLLSLHPQTRHMFYSFRYALTPASTGQALLDTLIRCVGDVSLGAMLNEPPRGHPVATSRTKPEVQRS